MFDGSSNRRFRLRWRLRLRGYCGNAPAPKRGHGTQIGRGLSPNASPWPRSAGATRLLSYNDGPHLLRQRFIVAGSRVSMPCEPSEDRSPPNCDIQSDPQRPLSVDSSRPECANTSYSFRLGERVKSTLCCPSRLGLLPCRKREKAVLG